MKNVRTYDYYDLLEFPSHKHLPVPKAVGLLIRKLGYSLPEALTLISQLSVSRRKRGYSFFSCPFCGDKSFFSGICAFCKEVDGMAFDTETYEPRKPFTNYYQRKRISNEAKEVLFVALVQQKQLTMLRYIETIPVAQKGEYFWTHWFFDRNR